MDTMDLLDLLGVEAIRLNDNDMPKSTMSFSTVLANGRIARMTISIELFEHQQPQSSPVSRPQPQTQPQPQPQAPQFSGQPQFR